MVLGVEEMAEAEVAVEGSEIVAAAAAEGGSEGIVVAFVMRGLLLK